MFLVNLPKTWPAVLAGTANAAEVTLGEWARVTDADLETYGDAVLGVHKNVVVSAYDITGWSRTPDGRVIFDGVESKEWARLRGQPVPGTPWVRGALRPVKTLDTNVLRGTAITPTSESNGTLTAVMGSTTVTVEIDGSTTVRTLPGTRVTVISQDTAA